MTTPLSNEVIQVAPMPQLAEAVDKKDDWTGITDSAARRKKQNRLNQRAYRRRKALEGQLVENAHNEEASLTHQRRQWQTTPNGALALSPQGSKVLEVLYSTLSNPPAPHLGPNGPPSQPSMILFPLSSDHLIPLIQLNVLRAIFTNMALLSILHEVPLDCSSVIAIPLHPTPTTLPPSLAPTPLQKSTPHPHWIDIVPSPVLRDNFIRLAGTIDEEELCTDFVGGLFEGEAEVDSRGWIVWTDPWDISGWEATEGFVKKWGFLLKGCGDLMRGTNRWRTLRGEEELVVEI